MSKPHLILASGSHARQNMLYATGLDFEIIPADIDEYAVMKKLVDADASPREIAMTLAAEKAIAVSKYHQNALVIGSDQVLEHQGEILSKAKTTEDARRKLRALRGDSHYLVSAVAVAEGGKILFDECDAVQLKMKDFDDAFLESYIEKAGDALTSCVGAYEYENYKEELFETYPDEEDKNNYFTILGMPLMPLVNYLIHEHGVEIK